MNNLKERYEKLGCACNPITIKKSIRINTLKKSEEETVARLKDNGAKLKKIPYTKHGYFYDAKFSLGATPEYLMGYYYLQESASQLPIQVLEPKPGELVLDMCASPGSKTTQMAQWMENKGKIIALDTENNRLMALKNNLERCGIINTIIFKKDARFVSDFKLEFDKILLDAPCSGNYAIEDKFFQTKNIQGIMERSRIQKELLRAAEKVLKKDGVLVYSTCSLEPEENEMNIDWLISKYKNLKLEETGLEIGEPGMTEIFGKKLKPELNKTRRFWPEKTGTEGFYVAKIRRIK
jgi:NOL1/NOP2/sun family putative RNA methylase